MKPLTFHTACARRSFYAGKSSRKTRKRPPEKVAGRKRCHEEATRTAPVPAEPHGPRRCGGPEHTPQGYQWVRIAGGIARLAARPLERSARNAVLQRLAEPATKSTVKVSVNWRNCRQPQKL